MSGALKKMFLCCVRQSRLKKLLQIGLATSSLMYLFKWLKEHGPQMITYRDISTQDEHFHLSTCFRRVCCQLALPLTSSLPWGKSTKPTGLFSTCERGQPLLPTRRFQLRGIKSVSLVMKCIKEPKSSFDCCQFKHQFSCKLDFKE